MTKKLSQIAPVWAKRIKDGTVRDHVTELDDFSRCIVGESWRYSDEYLKVCGTCHAHAFWLANFLDHERFKEIVASFEQHFNKEHLP